MPFLNPTYILALLVAISVHEWAHAVTATKLGDPTPGHAGRLTLNPIAHLDLVGALLFLTVGFGWAKPVPINPVYFRNYKRDTCLTAAAGPFSNLVLAIVAFTMLKIFGGAAGSSPWELLSVGGSGPVVRIFLLQFLGAFLFINLGLMAFNLIPIAPLDGSKVLEAFIPLSLSDRYEEFMRIGIYVLIGLLLAENFLHIPLLSLWIVTIMEWVLHTMESVSALFL